MASRRTALLRESSTPGGTTAYLYLDLEFCNFSTICNDLNYIMSCCNVVTVHVIMYVGLFAVPCCWNCPLLLEFWKYCCWSAGLLKKFGFRVIRSGFGYPRVSVLGMNLHPNWSSGRVWVSSSGFGFGCPDTPPEPNPTCCHP